MDLNNVMVLRRVMNYYSGTTFGTIIEVLFTNGGLQLLAWGIIPFKINKFLSNDLLLYNTGSKAHVF